MQSRQFKCSVQDEPFGRRWFLSGRLATHLKAVTLDQATHYAAEEVGKMVDMVREAWGPNAVITVL